MTQSGEDFTWTQLYPAGARVSNKFSVGKGSDMETIGGKKFKVCACVCVCVCRGVCVCVCV